MWIVRWKDVPPGAYAVVSNVNGSPDDRPILIQKVRTQMSLYSEVKNSEQLQYVATSTGFIGTMEPDTPVLWLDADEEEQPVLEKIDSFREDDCE